MARYFASATKASLLALAAAAACAAGVTAAPASSSPSPAPTPTQCPDHTTAGCSAPLWAPNYAMAASTYFYCFGFCAVDWLANNTAPVNPELLPWAGVLGVDHYWTHQGMPCVDGIPQEFALQDAFTIATKARFPQARVLQYRITDAVPYAQVVHDKMVADPGAFVQWPNGSVCQMPYDEHGTDNQGCAWPIRAAAYNYSIPAVRQWYLDNIIAPTLVHADGAWIDGDGPDNGAWMCSGSYDYAHLPAPYPPISPQQIDGFCEGEDAVVTAANEFLISRGGFSYDCFTFINSPQTLPWPGDAPAACAAKLQALDHRPSPTGATVLYGTRTGGAYNDTWAPQAVAAFMLTRGDHWWMQVPDGNAWDKSTAALLLRDDGPPVGNMTQPSPNVFSRTFERAVVTLDCNTFVASFNATSTTAA